MGSPDSSLLKLTFYSYLNVLSIVHYLCQPSINQGYLYINKSESKNLKNVNKCVSGGGMRPLFQQAPPRQGLPGQMNGPPPRQGPPKLSDNVHFFDDDEGEGEPWGDGDNQMGGGFNNFGGDGPPQGPPRGGFRGVPRGGRFAGGGRRSWRGGRFPRGMR